MAIETTPVEPDSHVDRLMTGLIFTLTLGITLTLLYGYRYISFKSQTEYVVLIGLLLSTFVPYMVDYTVISIVTDPDES